MASHLRNWTCSAEESADTSRNEGRLSSRDPAESEPSLAMGVAGAVVIAADEDDTLLLACAVIGPEPDGVLACLASIILFASKECGLMRRGRTQKRERSSSSKVALC